MGCDYYIEHNIRAVGVAADGRQVELPWFFYHNEHGYFHSVYSYARQMAERREVRVVCKDGVWDMQKVCEGEIEDILNACRREVPDLVRLEWVKIESDTTER